MCLVRFANFFFKPWWKFQWGLMLLVSIFCLSVLDFPVRAQTNDTTDIILEVLPLELSDVILIPRFRQRFVPNRDNPEVFGEADLQFGIVNETRISSGTCYFYIRPYAKNNISYQVYTEKLEPPVAPFQNNGCSTILPKEFQSFHKWDIEIRIINTNNGLDYGADPSYFMKYGAYGFVSIGGSNL